MLSGLSQNTQEFVVSIVIILVCLLVVFGIIKSYSTVIRLVTDATESFVGKIMKRLDTSVHSDQLNNPNYDARRAETEAKKAGHAFNDPNKGMFGLNGMSADSGKKGSGNSFGIAGDVSGISNPETPINQAVHRQLDAEDQQRIANGLPPMSKSDRAKRAAELATKFAGARVKDKLNPLSTNTASNRVASEQAGEHANRGHEMREALRQKRRKEATQQAGQDPNAASENPNVASENMMDAYANADRSDDLHDKDNAIDMNAYDDMMSDVSKDPNTITPGVFDRMNDEDAKGDQVDNNADLQKIAKGEGNQSEFGGAVQLTDDSWKDLAKYDPVTDKYYDPVTDELLDSATGQPIAPAETQTPPFDSEVAPTNRAESAPTSAPESVDVTDPTASISRDTNAQISRNADDQAIRFDPDSIDVNDPKAPILRDADGKALLDNQGRPLLDPYTLSKASPELSSLAANGQGQNQADNVVNTASVASQKGVGKNTSTGLYNQNSLPNEDNKPSYEDKIKQRAGLLMKNQEQSGIKSSDTFDQTYRQTIGSLYNGQNGSEVHPKGTRQALERASSSNMVNPVQPNVSPKQLANTFAQTTQERVQPSLDNHQQILNQMSHVGFKQGNFDEYRHLMRDCQAKTNSAYQRYHTLDQARLNNLRNEAINREWQQAKQAYDAALFNEKQLAGTSDYFGQRGMTFGKGYSKLNQPVQIKPKETIETLKTLREDMDTAKEMYRSMNSAPLQNDSPESRAALTALEMKIKGTQIALNHAGFNMDAMRSVEKIQAIQDKISTTFALRDEDLIAEQNKIQPFHPTE